MKKSKIQTTIKQNLEGMSKSDLLSLALQGLKQAKQRQYRLKKGGYELGNYINTFNRKINAKRLRRDTPGELKSDIEYIHRFLISNNTSVSGRIQKSRDILTEMSSRVIVGNPAVKRISGGFKVGDSSFTDTELADFFKKVRKLEEMSSKWRLSKGTDYEVLSTVFDEWFNKGVKSMQDLLKKVDEKLKQDEIKDVFDTVADDEEDD